MSRERSPEEQALDSLVSELRELPAPDLDWDRVEARLMKEPRPAAGPVWHGFFGGLRLPALVLVAVATAIVVFASHHAPAPLTPPKPVARAQLGPVNGDALALGTHVSAGNRDVIVEHAGCARWTLDPYATASVTDAGEFLTVRLESGALSASVIPQPKPETFAVEVGGTRVAVHGTAFRVERVGDRVLVEVTEGTVAVEPTSTHSDPSFLLRRGSRGNFGLDGRTGTVEGNASVVMHASGPKSRREIGRVAVSSAVSSAAPSTAHAATLSSAAVVSTPATAEPPAAPSTSSLPSAPKLPEQPSISDIESGVSSALDLMNRCFQQTHSTDIHVSVNTGMTLSVAGDGSVQSVTFEPPLAPSVEDCCVAGLRSLAFARSVEGATFTRILELKR